MKGFIGLFLILGFRLMAGAQQMTVQQIKTELEKSANGPLYVKDVLKKKFKIDTVTISRIGVYQSLADSIAYVGKVNKVFGPYGEPGKRFLVQVLAKAPNTFFRIGQIFIDTSVFRYKVADSIGKRVMQKIGDGSSTFEQMAQTYSMGGEAATKGDIGWVAKGTLLPQIERELEKRKKGEVFKTWSRNGLHIIKKLEEPRQDTGFALLMRVFL